MLLQKQYSFASPSLTLLPCNDCSFRGQSICIQPKRQQHHQFTKRLTYRRQVSMQQQQQQQQQKMDENRAVVIGGGPVGLFTAIALARRNKNVTVLEREPEPLTSVDKTRSYTISVSSRGLDSIKKDHQVYESLQRYSLSGNIKRIILGHDKKIQVIDHLSKVFDRPVCRGFRIGILKAFYDVVATFPNIQVIKGAKVNKLSFSPNGTVSIHYNDNQNCIKSKFVLACDGKNSVVITSLKQADNHLVTSKNGWDEHPTGTPSSNLYIRSILLNADVLSGVIQKLITESKDNDDFIVSHNAYIVLRGDSSKHKYRTFDIVCSGTVQLFVDEFEGRIGSIYQNENHELWKLQSVEQAYELFEENFPQLSKQVIRDLVTVDTMQTFISRGSSTVGKVRRSGSLVGYVGDDEKNKGVIMLLGDSSHSFPPDLGLGVNTGFEDVDVLRSIIDNNSSYSDRDVAEAYEKARDDEIDALTFCVTHGRSIIYNQITMKEPLKFLGHHLKMFLRKFFPQWIHLPIGILMIEDLPFTEIRRRSVVTTRRLWYVVVGMLAIVTLMFTFFLRFLFKM